MKLAKVKTEVINPALPAVGKTLISPISFFTLETFRLTRKHKGVIYLWNGNMKDWLLPEFVPPKKNRAKTKNPRVFRTTGAAKAARILIDAVVRPLVSFVGGEARARDIIVHFNGRIYDRLHSGGEKIMEGSLVGSWNQIIIREVLNISYGKSVDLMGESNKDRALEMDNMYINTFLKQQRLERKMRRKSIIETITKYRDSHKLSPERVVLHERFGSNDRQTSQVSKVRRNGVWEGGSMCLAGRFIESLWMKTFGTTTTIVKQQSWSLKL